MEPRTQPSAHTYQRYLDQVAGCRQPGNASRLEAITSRLEATACLFPKKPCREQRRCRGSCLLFTAAISSSLCRPCFCQKTETDEQKHSITWQCHHLLKTSQVCVSSPPPLPGASASLLDLNMLNTQKMGDFLWKKSFPLKSFFFATSVFPPFSRSDALIYARASAVSSRALRTHMAAECTVDRSRLHNVRPTGKIHTQPILRVCPESYVQTDI